MSDERENDRGLQESVQETGDAETDALKERIKELVTVIPVDSLDRCFGGIADLAVQAAEEELEGAVLGERMAEIDAFRRLSHGDRAVGIASLFIGMKGYPSEIEMLRDLVSIFEESVAEKCGSDSPVLKGQDALDR
jgi:hypothetical protein